MKILKKILLVVAIIIAIPLIVALFVKKDYAVQREVTINKPKQEVFNYVKYIKNQDYYNKWAMQDAQAKKQYEGTDGTVGFVSSWDGKEIGKGEQVIKNISEGERIDLGLHFIEPFEGKANAWLITEQVSDKGTKLKWGMEGRNPYPFNVMNLFMDGMLGKDLEISLVNLKSILEN